MAEENTINTDSMTPESRQEGLKLFYKVFNHLTTLSFGSVIVLATFLDKFRQSHWRPLIALSFLGFLIAIVGSITVMLSTARIIRRNETTDQLPDETGSSAYLVAAAGSALGILSLCVFGIRNF